MAIPVGSKIKNRKYEKYYDTRVNKKVTHLFCKHTLNNMNMNAHT